MTEENKNHPTEKVNFNRELALFYFAYRAFTKHADDLVTNYNIRKVHRRIIFFVGRMPGLTVNELLDVLDITKQALNTPMNELIDRGFIEAKQNEQDRRSKNIYLTTEGQKLDERLNSDQISKMKQYFLEANDPEGNVWNKIMELYANEVGKEYIDRIE